MAFAPLALTIIVALAIGAARRGRVTNIAGTRLHSLPLLFLALAAGLGVDRFDVPAPELWAIGGLLAAVVFTLRNLQIAGMAIIGVGVLANLAPLVVNGTTPVRAMALVEAGMVIEADLDRVSLSGPRELSDDSTALAWLGDTIPVAPFEQVMSFGDLIVLVGLVTVVVNTMMQRRRRRLPASCLASLEAFGWHETDEREGSIIELRTEMRPLYPEDEGEIVRVFASTSANAVQDWGVAPPPEPVSESQYSANPDATAPSIVRPRTASVTSVAAESRAEPSEIR